MFTEIAISGVIFMRYTPWRGNVGRIFVFTFYPYDYLTRQVVADRKSRICHRLRRRSSSSGATGFIFFSPPPLVVASIPRRTCMLANGCGQIMALPAFETLLTLRILARRARLTSLCPVENDDITIKLPSAYGN